MGLGAGQASLPQTTRCPTDGGGDVGEEAEDARITLGYGLHGIGEIERPEGRRIGIEADKGPRPEDRHSHRILGLGFAHPVLAKVAHPGPPGSPDLVWRARLGHGNHRHLGRVGAAMRDALEATRSALQALRNVPQQ